MAFSKSDNKNRLVSRKDSIVTTALDVMNELGVQSLSTREVARREGITEGAIFRHFAKKRDLYLAILHYYSQYDNDIMETIYKKELQPIEAIEFYFETYSTYYENYPAVTVVLQNLDQMSYYAELAQAVKDLLNRRLDFIAMLVKKAQEQEQLEATIEPEIMSQILLGTLLRICLQWRINKYDFSLKDKTSKAIASLLTAYKV